MTNNKDNKALSTNKVLGLIDDEIASFAHEIDNDNEYARVARTAFIMLKGRIQSGELDYTEPNVSYTDQVIKYYPELSDDK